MNEAGSAAAAVAARACTWRAGKPQDAGLISYARGRISVLDCPAPEKRVSECFVGIEKEFDRLLPKNGAR